VFTGIGVYTLTPEAQVKQCNGDILNISNDVRSCQGVLGILLSWF
jgi:hypothetical protein